MQSRFSSRSHSIINLAVQTASDMGHIYVGTEHLLYSLVATDGFPPDLDSRDIRAGIEQLGECGEKTFLTPEDMTPAMRKILVHASENTPMEQEVEPIDIFIALLSSDCVATRLLDDMDIDTESLKKILERKKTNKMSAKKEARFSTPTLDRYSISLTEKAAAGEIDPVVGRSAEEQRVIRILLRRRKNNPLLIGEAGVGKTAVAEAIALRIASGDVPNEMKTKRILSLDMACLVAGTKYRGEFEDKLRTVIREATEDKDVILFIDEIHTMVGAGAADGAVDAANILKPALARGEIQLIGATTPKEYKRSIEKDTALARRFQTVSVSEPTVDECKAVLCALKSRYEKHHGVHIDWDALSAAAEYSHRFISGRYLPDKAIDLMDEAASAKRINGGERVTKVDIALLTQEISGVPAEFITESGETVWERVYQSLEENIIGQQKAIEAVTAAVRRRASLVSDTCRPAGSMLFYGPSGVGKTECARVLAYAMSGTGRGFISIDMSEYSEPHSVSRLIGAPPGYTGCGEGGLLTEAVRRRPFSVVLFDGVEKAHPDVKSIIYQILDKGVLTDSDGLEVSFADATVIITACAESCASCAGFNRTPSSFGEKSFSPELSSRVGDVIRFSALDTEALEEICEKRVQQLVSAASERGAYVSMPESALKKAVEECGGSARVLCREITRAFQDEMLKKQGEKVR